MSKAKNRTDHEPRKDSKGWTPETRRELSERIENMSVEELADFFDNTDTADLPLEDVSTTARIERPELEQISVRLPKSDLDALRRRAERSGVGYTTLLRMILHEHVNSPLTR